MSKPKKIVLALCAVAVLGVLVGYGYILFIKEDAPDALDTGDLDAALGADSETTVASDATDATERPRPPPRPKHPRPPKHRPRPRPPPPPRHRPPTASTGCGTSAPTPRSATA